MARGRLLPEDEIAKVQILAIIESALDHSISRLAPDERHVGRRMRMHLLEELGGRFPEILVFLKRRQNPYDYGPDNPKT